VARDPSARRWVIAELVAYSAWTAELTYAGAFYIDTYGVSEASVGFLLAVGSIAFLIATLSAHRIALRFQRRQLVVGTGLAMGAFLAVFLNVTPAVWFSLGVICVVAVCAGLRSTGSSALGLNQLPAHPGSMMAARTVSAQLGYMVGAVVGGVVLAVAGFGTLGWVLFGGMAFSAWVVARVRDPVRTVA
jgi:predicted MFS family arabinose efflux permease